MEETRPRFLRLLIFRFRGDAYRLAARGRGEMQLAVDWQAVPALFSWLARCGMRATAFSLQPEKQALRLTLQLEAEDAVNGGVGCCCRSRCWRRARSVPASGGSLPDGAA
jgi:hypothetical protein